MSERPTDPGLHPMKQLPLDLGPGPQAGLDTFEVGHNAELLDWLRAWPGAMVAGRPAYLWGEPGAGKSHLLRGLAQRALSQGWNVLWLDAGGFQTWDGWQPDEGPTLLLLDDCQRLDAAQQHWAFQLFLEQAASLAASPSSGGIAIVAAGSVPSVDLPVRDDLKTRLGWGLGFAVQPLSEAGIRQVLLREAQRRGMSLGDGVLSWMLTRLHRNMGHLMALLERLDRYALAEQRLLTVPLLKQMLAQEIP